MTKPIIGITSNFMADIPEAVKAGIAAPNQPWVLLADDYVQALERAGAVPVILPAHVRFEENENLFSRLDGVVLSGGNDVSASIAGCWIPSGTTTKSGLRATRWSATCPCWESAAAFRC